MFCYFNNGTSMRAVDPDYTVQAGEVLFPDYATDAQLATAFPGYVPPKPPSPTVAKAVVMDRVISAGKMVQAQSSLWASPELFAKWFAPGYPDVDCDDHAAVTFITALDLDPAVILAP